MIDDTHICFKHASYLQYSELPRNVHEPIKVYHERVLQHIKLKTTLYDYIIHNLTPAKSTVEQGNDDEIVTMEVDWKTNTYMFMHNKIYLTCEICGRLHTTVSHLRAHIKRTHNISDITLYADKYGFSHLQDDPVVKCGFCHRDAKRTLDIDFKNKTYRWYYFKGLHKCDSEECRDNVCLKFFGKPYKDCIQQYDHIGAKTEYLMCINGMSRQDVVKVKKCPNPKGVDCSLDGFIARHGVELGTIKYHERCDKIRKTHDIQWFIDRYGEEKGPEMYQIRRDKMFNISNYKRISKAQRQIFNKLKQQDKNWKLEHEIIPHVFVDMYNPNTNVIVEYYGDYWHGNPAIYKDTFFNKMCNMTVADIHKHDNERLDRLINETTSKIIIVWEKSYFTLKDNIINTILNNLNTNIRVIWI